ncbi:MAG: ATP-binding cassette domain-containing protein [Planctomycetes bacterium]|nr:ATP-binding cassette domain-containing protein [Planctomycetota bacterium]
MKALEVANVSHWFGTNRVLHDVNLEIEAGQIVSVVGPSGCGKSTLLRAILGTHPPKKGEIRVDGELIDRPNRNVGIVYQHYSLYDFLTAQQNAAFGLMLDQTSLPFRAFQFWRWRRLHKQHMEQAAALLIKVGLEDAIKLYPGEMSGGMRQRVAIAQTLIMKPKLLLLDEPFGALDEATREELQLMLLNLYQENLQARAQGQPPPHTIMIVTHELTEALYVADRVVGLSQYHQEGSQGATIVYDKAAPVFHPTDPREFGAFGGLKEELRAAVFDPGHLQHYQEYVSFWSEQQSLEEGTGT